MNYFDFLAGVQPNEIDVRHIRDLQETHFMACELEEASKRKLTVTSSYRTMKHHLEIYAAKNLKRKKLGLAPLPIPLHSRHLYGQACDISDPDGRLADWIFTNPAFYEHHNLYFEAFDVTRPDKYVHFQIVAPMSGSRFFHP